MSEPIYVWTSSGGCQRCDALDALEVPAEQQGSTPHPNCNCTVERHPGEPTACDENNIRYTVTYSHPIHHPNYVDGDSEFDMVYDYVITCPTGEVLTGEVLVTTTYDGHIDEPDDVDLEALEMVDDIAATECPGCPDPKLVS